MLKIEKAVTMSPEQYEIVIEGMRNPMNSWDKMDSITAITDTGIFYDIGQKDFDLMTRLAKGGPVHAKYRRMMPVWVTINAPLYWWKEFDTYKVGTVCNSCSTMHKIQAKEFTLDDFSIEHLLTPNNYFEMEPISDFFPEFEEKDGSTLFWTPLDVLKQTINTLNFYREKFLVTKKKPMKEEAKRKPLLDIYWWQMIQLLPSSYNQKRTYMLNYEVLHNIYFSRKNHKLDEWHTFCDWIVSLPYSEVITTKETGDVG